MKQASESRPPLRRPERSGGVGLLQGALIQAGHRMPKSIRRLGSPDGIFGNETEQAVRAFQTKEKLTVDGIAGRHTVTRLDQILVASERRVPPVRPPRLLPPDVKAPPSASAPTPPALPFRPPEDSDFAIGTGDPPRRHDAGAGVWNSSPTTFSTRALHAAMKLPAFQGAALIGVGSDATLHLNHYNGNSGRPLSIDLKDMIADVGSAKLLYQTLARKIVVFIQKLPAGTFDVTAKRSWGGYNLQSESRNWFFAVGGYSAWIKGRVAITGAGAARQYVFTGEYRLYDRYNWDTGKKVEIGGFTITDKAMGEFHRQGLSREYDELGSCAVRFSWRHGTFPPPEQLNPSGSR